MRTAGGFDCGFLRFRRSRGSGLIRFMLVVTTDDSWPPAQRPSRAIRAASCLIRTRDQRPHFRKVFGFRPIAVRSSAIFPAMDEAWEDPASGYGDQPSGAAVVYRGPNTQREVDAIFARLRAWRELGRKS